MKKAIGSLICLITIFLTGVSISVSASGWGFSRNSKHQTPQIGKYQDLIKDTDSYYVMDTSEKNVLLTLDAGYDNGILPGILDILKLKNVRASFFITGDFVNRFPELTMRIVRDGHIACNHSYGHKNITKLTLNELETDLARLDEKFEQLTGTKMTRYFRPPAGEFNRSSLLNLKQLGYKTVFWSIAYMDWHENKQTSADYAVKAVVDNIHPGAIILLHSVSSANKEALPEMIDQLLAMGYQFKTVLDL